MTNAFVLIRGRTGSNHLVAIRPRTKDEYDNYIGIFDSLIKLKPVSTELYALCLEGFDTDESYCDGSRKEGIGYFNYRSVDFAHRQTIVSTLRMKSLSTFIILPANSDYGSFEERVTATIGDIREDFGITSARVPPGDLHSNPSVHVSSVVARSTIDAILSAEAAKAAQVSGSTPKNAVVKGAFESWVVGFISGLNVSGDREIVGGGDFTAIVAWMDQRCRSRPTDQIGVAALDLAMELAGNAAKR